jgi:hypothetical protein
MEPIWNATGAILSLAIGAAVGLVEYSLLRVISAVMFRGLGASRQQGRRG